MKIVFVNPAQEMGGIQCLSSFVKQHGIDTALVNDPRFFNNPWVQMPRLNDWLNPMDRLVEKVLSHEADLIALTVVADDFQWALNWSRELKKKTDTPIVFGNIFPTTSPEEVLCHDSVDFIVRGEGEFTLLELCQCLEKGSGFETVLGLGFKKGREVVINKMRPLIQDLDILPFPDKDLTYNQMPYLNNGYTTMTGRGCPYRCTFCDNTTSRNIYKAAGEKTKWTRRHSPEYVVEELRWAKERYDIQHIRFNDEDFSYDKRWVRKFCELYIESGIEVPWFAWVYPNTIDKEIAELMAKAGCDAVEMGIQSGSARLRKDVIYRNTPNKKIIEAMQLFREVGIRCTVDVIVGLPTETEEDLKLTSELIIEGQPWHIYVFWLRYYNKTEIFKIAKDLGLIGEVQIKEVEGGGYSKGILAGGTEEENAEIARNYNSFIALLPILPQKVARWILKKNLVRRLPYIQSFILVNLTKTFKPNPYDEFRDRVPAMYWYEFRALFKNQVGNIQVSQTPREVFKPSYTWLSESANGSESVS